MIPKTPVADSPALTSRRFPMRSTGLLAAGLMFLVILFQGFPAMAQQEEDNSLNGLFNRSTDQMQKAQWAEALKTLNKLIEIYGGPNGSEGMRSFGPAFGLMYYRRGYCYKNLGQFDEAIANFKICFEKYPNAEDTEPNQNNPVWALAALEMGASYQAKGQFGQALEWYEKFMSLKPDPDLFDMTAFRLQMATSLVKSGDLAKGRELMEIVFQGADGGRARPAALFRGFLALIEGWVATDAKQANMMESEALAFIHKQKEKLNVSPFDKGRFGFNGRLLGYARDASEKGMFSLAIKLIGLMSSPSDILADLRNREARLQNPPPALLEEIEKYEGERQAEDSIEIAAQMILANAYEMRQNYRPGYAIYSQLALEFPEHKYRPDFLYGATRCGIALQDISSAVFFGMKFREEFPEHGYIGAVNSLLIESLFYAGKYSEVLEIAQRVRSDLEVGSEERDMPDFAYSCSLFYLGRHLEAEPELQSHMDSYPDSNYREIVSFCHASNPIRLDDFVTGGKRLDQFLAEYPTSSFRSYALLDRADCHFQLGQDEMALERTDVLIQQDPAFPEMDRVMGLRGDCYYALEEYEPAMQSYTRSLELAERGGESRSDHAARALLQLAAISVETGEEEQAVAYYDRYMENYGDGFYDAQIVVTCMDALVEAGRAEEVLRELESVIIRIGSGESGVGLEEAINSYVDFYVTEVGAEEAYDRLTNFPVPPGMEVNEELRSWLLISRIGILEDASDEQFPRRDAEMRLAYDQLREFDEDSLAPFIAVKVGMMLVDSGTPTALQEAEEFFDSVIKRGPAAANYGVALLGQARLLAESASADDQQKALALFDKAITDLEDDRSMVERATIAKGKLLFKMERWEDSAKVFRFATEQDGWTQDRALVYFLLGRSYEAAGDVNNALASYFAFFAPPHQSRIEYSAEARLRAARLQEDRDKKLEAFKALRDTLRGMHKFDGDERLQAQLPYQTIENPIGKAKEMYVRLRGELDVETNPDEELNWDLPEA